MELGGGVQELVSMRGYFGRGAEEATEELV
jgi:hypothetical protein